MNVFRIAKSEFIKDLSGTGARLYGGRWNPKGIRVLYTSENKSLAALEVLVHFNRNSIPWNLNILTLKIPQNTVNLFDMNRYHEILQDNDPGLKFQEEGKKWIESKESLGLIVPSVLVPGENNILINPAHDLFSSINIENIEDFNFDDRFVI